MSIKQGNTPPKKEQQLNTKKIANEQNLAAIKKHNELKNANSQASLIKSNNTITNNNIEFTKIKEQNIIAESNKIVEQKELIREEEVLEKEKAEERKEAIIEHQEEVVAQQQIEKIKEIKELYEAPAEKETLTTVAIEEHQINDPAKDDAAIGAVAGENTTNDAEKPTTEATQDANKPQDEDELELTVYQPKNNQNLHDEELDSKKPEDNTREEKMTPTEAWETLGLKNNASYDAYKAKYNELKAKYTPTEEDKNHPAEAARKNKILEERVKPAKACLDEYYYNHNTDLILSPMQNSSEQNISNSRKW